MLSINLDPNEKSELISQFNIVKIKGVSFYNLILLQLRDSIMDCTYRYTQFFLYNPIRCFSIFLSIRTFKPCTKTCLDTDGKQNAKTSYILIRRE